jgi:hypothetical protein
MMKGGWMNLATPSEGTVAVVALAQKSGDTDEEIEHLDRRRLKRFASGDS